MMKFKQWITNNTNTPFYARKKIILSEKPEKAIIRICGLGQFRLFVNSRQVSEHVLDPAWTDYNKLIYYLQFDLTDYLEQGENVLAAEVGNGWYLCDQTGGYFFHFPSFMPPNPNPYKPFGRCLVLAAHLDVKFSKGKRKSFDADSSWKVASHGVSHSNVFGSEIVDGQKIIHNWTDKNLDDSDWENASIVSDEDVPKGRLERQRIPAVKVLHTYTGKYLGTMNGRSIYDFSQNTAGMLEFDIKGMVGQEVHAWPAEKLALDGDIDQKAKNWLDIDVCETYRLAKENEWETFSMTFTYVGCRYVAIDAPSDKIQNVRLRAISSAGEQAGSFWCDDQRYMQIYDLIEKAVEANMQSVHTDCPTIERFAWQEENHLMAPSIMYMKKVKLHWEKFLKDTKEAQLTASDYFQDIEGKRYYPGEGLIPSQAPCYIPNVLPIPGMGDFYDTPGWGSNIILGTWWHYLFYGDEKIVSQYYESGKRYLEHLKTKIDTDGFLSHGLGDWGNPTGEYARANIDTAFLYADAIILQKFAELLDKREEEQGFARFAEKVKKNYNKKLLVYNEELGGWCYRIWEKKKETIMSQATQALPLYWGMVPDDKEEDVVKSLKKILLDAGTFQTGEVGQPYIIQSMSKYGMNQLIADFILKEQHPSYYAFVLDGETTLGEYWEKNPRSHCHDMMGHIIEWFYNGIAGIRPSAPGFTKVLIKPWLPETMNEVSCSYESAAGRISVSMKRVRGKIELQVETPESIEVKIDRSFLVGKYSDNIKI